MAFQPSADSFGIRRLGFKCSWWHPSANPRRNLTEMLHVLGDQTGTKLSCIKPTSKVRGLSIEPCSSTVCID